MLSIKVMENSWTSFLFLLPLINSFQASSRLSKLIISSKLWQNSILLCTPPPRTVLPIIQRLILVYKIWHEYLPKFSKDHRYTLGFKIDSLFVEIIEILHEAQFISFKQKQPHLAKASSRFDTLKFFLQILWEVNGIDNKKYIHLSRHITDVGKKLGGWIKEINLKNQTLL